MQEIIVISGTAGTGKSFLAKGLARVLQYKYLSIGTMARKLASEMNVDIYEFQNICTNNHLIDKLLDDRFVSLVNSNSRNVVVDYRLGAYFFPSATKILLKTHIDEVARRVKLRDNDLADKSYTEIKRLLKYRTEMAKARFIELYKFDFTNSANYNLVIDNTNLSPDQTLNMALRYIIEIKNV